MDLAKLTQVLEDAKVAQESMSEYRERLADEIVATKDRSEERRVGKECSS